MTLFVLKFTSRLKTGRDAEEEVGGGGGGFRVQEFPEAITRLGRCAKIYDDDCTLGLRPLLRPF